MEDPLRGYGSGPEEGSRGQHGVGTGSGQRSQCDVTLPAVSMRAGRQSPVCFPFGN